MGAGGGGAAGKHDLLRQATSNVKRQKVPNHACVGRPFDLQNCILVLGWCWIGPVSRRAVALCCCLLLLTSPVACLGQVGRGPGGDPYHEAREVVGGEALRWAQEEAQKREAAKRQALAYVSGGFRGDCARLVLGMHASYRIVSYRIAARTVPQCTHGAFPPHARPAPADPLTGKDAAAAKRCLAVLKQAADTPGFLPPGGGGGGGAAGNAAAAGTHQQQQHLVDTLAALRCAWRPIGGTGREPGVGGVHGSVCVRCPMCPFQTLKHTLIPAGLPPATGCRELGHMYAPLSLVSMAGLKECLGKLQEGPQVWSGSWMGPSTSAVVSGEDLFLTRLLCGFPCFLPCAALCYSRRCGPWPAGSSSSGSTPRWRRWVVRMPSLSVPDICVC